MCFIVAKLLDFYNFFSQYSFQVEKNGCAFGVDRVFLWKFWVFKLSQLCIEHRKKTEKSLKLCIICSTKNIFPNLFSACSGYSLSVFIFRI